MKTVNSSTSVALCCSLSRIVLLVAVVTICGCCTFSNGVVDVRQPELVRVAAVAVDKSFADLATRKPVNEFQNELLATWRDLKFDVFGPWKSNQCDDWKDSMLLQNMVIDGLCMDLKKTRHKALLSLEVAFYAKRTSSFSLL